MPRIPEPEALEQHPDPLAALWDPVETAVEVEVLERRQLPVDERLVADITEPPALDCDVELAARGCGKPRAEAEEGRLARAVRPGDDEEVARTDVELDPAQDALLAVPLLETAGTDHTAASASTNAKKATLMTPLTLKNAASSRRRSSGRTSECSYASSSATTTTPAQYSQPR